MEIRNVTSLLRNLFIKYKYPIVILLIGLLLLLIPDRTSNKQDSIDIEQPIVAEETLLEASLAKILESVDGAGKVKVLLSIGAGEQTVYQTDSEISSSGDNNDQITKTVIVTNSERNESGLIQQVKPATYKGAIVVCQGADSSSVRLAVTQAVSKITGLGTDAICVLKMQ